jgi:hypothetical protein
VNTDGNKRTDGIIFRDEDMVFSGIYFAEFSTEEFL